jgi:carboxymethylenebutenolidase
MSENDDRSEPGTSRREFIALGLGAGLAAAGGAMAAPAASVVESTVEIKTADGTCDAALFHPSSGAYPGVLIWTDIFGLRPTFRDFGQRLAAQGYTVLIPNPFYRTAKAPVIPDVAAFDWQNSADRAKLQAFTGPLNAPGAADADAKSFVAYLDAQPQVDTKKKLGTQGYCMGGPLVVRTAAAVPERVGSGASFHGGGLVTDKPDSPHRLAPLIKARMYFAIAASDDLKQPDAKVELREAFKAAHVPAFVEVYPDTQHGWCVPDMPLQDGKAIYNKAEAEVAWARLLTLYAGTLALGRAVT